MDAAPTLPPPLLDSWTWQSEAACRGLDPDVFFSAPDEPTAVTRAVQVKRAKAVCARCPVAAACLEHALQTREPYGVWGGRSEAERAELLGLISLRYPARRARPRRRSAARRREEWRAAPGSRSAAPTQSVPCPPAVDPPTGGTASSAGKGPGRA